MGHVGMLFLVLALNHAFAQTFCTSTIDLETFLTRSYRANVDLIRLGVPSKVVKRYYDKAVIDMTLSCNCSSTTIDENCVSLFFTETMEVAYLKDLLHIDSVADENRDVSGLLKPNPRLFPLFRTNVTLQGLSISQTEELNKGANHLLSNSKSVVSIQSRYWQRSRFPADEEFFQDTFDAQKAACDIYQDIINATNLTYPAWAATSYVIGLILEIRQAGGNETAAMMMLEDCTSLVFSGVRCYRVNGNKLEYPVSKLEQYMLIAKELLDETDTLFKTDLRDIRKLSLVPSAYFFELVTTLSSLSSGGDGSSVLTTDGRTTRREAVNSTLGIDLPDIELINPGNARQECPEGYILASRAVPTVNVDELCCSEKCEFAQLSLLDPFAFAINQERCCGFCNYLECTDHSLLPESTPLKYAGTATLISI
eukprot:TRINITY_DN78021_c0_g1_i1.p1 TRINITY_DN78021_c0_g1~~TRINITY_DN78021_c0_g1_i1.p1  ORF type:complete len:425 (+),score=40.29 TRINITY_DN78021_c0_g1_i1:414-1688(+)